MFQTQDLMWAVVFASAACEVDLWTSDDNTQTFQLNAGVSKINMPLTETGGYMRARLQRNGNIVTDFAPADYFYQTNPTIYNFNAFTASSPGATVPSAPSSPSTPPPPASHQIHPDGNTAKCLEVQGGVFSDGTLVQMYVMASLLHVGKLKFDLNRNDCNGSSAQNWVISEGATTVQVAGADFCLDAGTSTYIHLIPSFYNINVSFSSGRWYSDENLAVLLGLGCPDLVPH